MTPQQFAPAIRPRDGQIRAIRVPGRRAVFTRDQWTALAGLYGSVALLHVVGCALFLYYAARYPALLGLGLAAYMFGLRHAFDADHIAAIDDTVRYLLQEGRQPLGIGFYFSLGHSTIVFVLAAAVMLAASAVKQSLPALQSMGGVIGASISGVFLIIIGVLNLLVLLDMLRGWRRAKSGEHDHVHVEELLARRGMMNRLFGGRLRKLIRHSWQMYPLGVLFGLGFDTASEIGVLAMSAGAAAGNLPMSAVLSLPILFAAGMSMMDTTDGVLMSKAYSWAFVNPLRKIFYNLATTSLSLAVALVIGSIELLQVYASLLDLHGAFFDRVAALDFGVLGDGIVGLFMATWIISVAIWHFGRIGQLPGKPRNLSAHGHIHQHAGGLRHSHRHFH
ncbi:MAG: HoxN/HupN/NixA family nickel/cobalt transporter [Casimicrobiaceae bacterium]